MWRDKKVIIGFAILIKLAISLPFINSFPIDLDEPFSIFHAQKTLPDLMSLFGSENNPPLHFVLLHFWEKIFGIDPASVRSLSLLFSVLTIPVLYSVGRKFLSDLGTSVLLILFIFSDFHHYHGLEARTYSLLIFLFTLTLLCLSTIIPERKYNYRNFILLAVLNILLFYTHYISILILLTEALILIIYFNKANLKLYLISLFVFILAVLPWFNVLLKRTGTITNHGTWIEQAQFSELYGLMNKFLNDKWAMLALLVCMLILFISSGRKLLKIITIERQKLILLFIFGLSPYFMAFLLSRFMGVNLFYDRYLFYINIPVFIVIVLLFDRFETNGRILLGLFVIAYIFRFDLIPNNDRDGDKIAAYVQSLPESEILIAPDYYDLTFLYHYDRKLFSDYKSVESHTMGNIVPLGTEISLKEPAKVHDNLILVNANIEFTQPDNTIIDDLKSNFKLKSQQKFKGNYTVSLWEKDLNAEPKP